jgi:hypothetical protein
VWLIVNPFLITSWKNIQEIVYSSPIKQFIWLNLHLEKILDLQFLLLQRVRKVDLFTLVGRNLLRRINYVIKTVIFNSKKGNNVLEVQVIRRSNPV